MSSLRLLHVDDEPDIREIVELSLSLDSAFSILSCGSGTEALATAADWSPHLILCDVMMPVMDGPAMLARLRQCPQTADIPLIFMTARAQTRELEHFRSLGAIGIISKPFDPMTLANSIRSHLRDARFDKIGDDFLERLRANRITLVQCRVVLRSDPTSSAAMEKLQGCAHKLSGAAGMFGFPWVSCAAEVLEESTIEWRSSRGSSQRVESNIDMLVGCIEHALDNGNSRVVHGERT